MLKLRQYFCKHDYKCIAQHKHTQSNLWKCKKCDVYYIQHYGIGIGYKCKVPNVGGWVRHDIQGVKIMNLDDLFKRVTKEDGRKVFVFRDKDGGWSNVHLDVKEHVITITLDDNGIFSDDK